MKDFFPKYKWHIYISMLLLYFILLILPISTRVRVSEGELYYSKNEVSLYIYEYGSLPSNYLTKSQATAIFGSYDIAMENGFNIGGDTFDYRGEITNMTDQISLYESDIYKNRDLLIDQNSRGTYRLVFASNGTEVFYTKDHYSSFSLVTLSEIQATSTIFMIIFIMYNLLFGLFYINLTRMNVIEPKSLMKDYYILLKSIVIIIYIPFFVIFTYSKEGLIKLQGLFKNHSTHMEK